MGIENTVKAECVRLIDYAVSIPTLKKLENTYFIGYSYELTPQLGGCKEDIGTLVLTADGLKEIKREVEHTTSYPDCDPLNVESKTRIVSPSEIEVIVDRYTIKIDDIKRVLAEIVKQVGYISGQDDKHLEDLHRLGGKIPELGMSWEEGDWERYGRPH